ncbi:MAG TPA: hypothetical protein VKR59_06755 [Terriglobales bacterium]|nr:hypothetical protein [Terriglobales bacterium]
MTDSSSPAPCAFRGDFAELAAVIRRSWANNSNQPLFYSEAFLRSAFEYPGGSFSLSPAVYGETGLLGFLAGFPRNIRWNGEPTRIILNTLLTAATTVKGPGVAVKLWTDMVERSRNQGYSGTITYCVEGDGMDRMMPLFTRLLKLNTVRIFSTQFLVRLLFPESSPVQTFDRCADIDINVFMELASDLPGKLPLVRLWTRPEAEWQCRDRAGAIAVSYDSRGRHGILTGYLMQATSVPVTTVVLLEDLLWGDLEPAECAELLKKFLQIAADRGARFASCPVLGYAASDPLTDAGFRRSRRVIHAYLTFWNGFQPEQVPGLYLDVL